LLCSSRETASATELLVKKVAKKARLQNEKQKVVVLRLKQEKRELTSSKRSALEQVLKHAGEKKSATLADKSSKARSHFASVISKASDCQQQKTDSATKQKRRLARDLAQKITSHEATVSGRKSRAGEHNKLVAQKVQEHTLNLQQRTDKLVEQLKQKAQRHQPRRVVFGRRLVAPIVEFSQSVAWEIAFKKSQAAGAVTPERFQRSASGETGLLRAILGGFVGLFWRPVITAPETNLATESRATGIAERARVQNEKKEVVAMRHKQEQDKLIASKRSTLEQVLKRVGDKKSATLADRSSKAHMHFEAVLSKVDACLSQKADSTAEQQRRVEEDLAQKRTCLEASVSGRKSRACQHNKIVAQKVQKRKSAGGQPSKE